MEKCFHVFRNQIKIKICAKKTYFVWVKCYARFPSFNNNFKLILTLILKLFFTFVVDTTLNFSKMNFLRFISENFDGFISTHHFISTIKPPKFSVSLEKIRVVSTTNVKKNYFEIIVSINFKFKLGNRVSEKN
jgi:hypothetical protein